jgi:hypothetical protein
MEEAVMSSDALADAVATLREHTARLWRLAERILTTENTLEVRSIAGTLDEVADRLETVLVGVELDRAPAAATLPGATAAPGATG